MVSLRFVGKTAITDGGITTRLAVDNQLAEGLGQEYTDGQVITVAQDYATKGYVDTADAGFIDDAYYQGRDALNVPNAARGAANGVASLDGTGKIPAAQVPVLGTGVIKGPWGVTTTSTGTTGTTPLKIAGFTIGVTGFSFRPLVYLVALIDVDANARPVVEVRIGGPSDTTYASQTKVAIGTGRAVYNDIQTVGVFPGSGLGVADDGPVYSANLDARLTVWVYCATSDGTLTVGTDSIWSASAFAMRVSQ
jgi:hypothetical protein